ncbi:hypothetical protein BKA82DRAFT_4240642, partial [Pisolithus tinctorius]
LGSSPLVRRLLNRLLHLPFSILLYYAFTPAYVVYISCRIRMCYRVRPRFSLHRMCTLLFVRLVRIRLLVSLSLFLFYCRRSRRRICRFVAECIGRCYGVGVPKVAHRLDLSTRRVSR